MNNESPVVAGMDVHKKMLAVVVAKVDGNRIEYLSERFGTTRQDLDQLAHWLHQQQVTEVAMESTAQYWMPVWLALEEQFTLYLAQPRSTAAPKGRKSDWADAQRIVRRLLAQDLTLSYVPGREQREWRTMTRTRVEMSAQQVRLRNQMEGLLEQAQIKLSSVLSDLLGVSGRRILREMVKGETNPACLASLADKAVKASEKTLQEALGGKLTATHRLLLKMYLEQWDLLASQIDQHPDGSGVEPASSRRTPARGDSRSQPHRRPTDHRRGGAGGPCVRRSGETGFLGRRVSRSAPKCGNRVLASFPQRQPHDAACPGPMCLGQREGQGEYLSPEIPRLGAPARSAPSYLGDCPSVAADHLEASP